METTVFQILHVLNESQVFVPARQIAEQLGLSGTALIMPFLTRMAAEGLVRYESGEGYALPESREFEELVNVAGPFADKLQESGIALVSVAPSEDLPEEIEVERRESSDLLSSLADYERVIADGGLSHEAFEVFFSEAAQDENLAVEDENGVRWVLNDAGYWLPQIDEVRKAASKGGYWRTTKNGHRIYIEGGKITKGNPYLLKIVAAGQKKKKAKKRTESFETVESVDDAEVLKVVFLAGGSGSGKSFVATKAFSGTGLRVVNSDAQFEYLMRKAKIDMKTQVGSPEAQALRPEAKRLTRSRETGYITGRLGLLIDGTGDEYEKIVAKKAQLEALGYDCSMLFVSVPIDIARARNAARARVVPDAVLVAAHAGAQESKSKYKALFGAQFVEYENAEELSDVEVRGKMVPELVRLTRRLIAGPVRNPIGREWVKSQLSASELATHPALSESADLRALAKEIRADWKSMPSGISSLVKEFEQQESSIWTIRAVRYFLAQSKGWQGDTANRIKSELRKFLSESVEEAEKPDDLDATYASWRKSVNMSASQLRAWSNSPCSRKASLSASAVIERNLELLETPKEKWDSRLVANAKRTISFIARMSKMEQGEPVSEECKISKRDISLKNWAYDPAKGRNESVEDGIGSNQYPMDLRVGMRVRFVTGGSGSYGSGTTGTIIGRNNENNLWIVRDDAGGVEEWERMDLHPEIQPQDYDARTDADLEMASESEISEWGVAAQRGRVRAMQQARDRVRFAGSRSDDDEDEEEPKGRKSDKKDSDEEEVEERTVSANVGGFDPDLLGAGEEDEDYEDEDEEEDDISPEAEFGEAHWSSGLKSDGLPRFATQDGEDEEDSEAEVVIEAAAKTVKVWPKDQEDHRKIMAEYSKALMDRKNAVSLNASRRMRKLETVPVPELPSKPVFPFAFDGSRYIGMLDADFENLSPDEIAKQLKRAGAEVEGKISVRWLHHANEALDEVSPPGFKGTVKAMKRAQARGDIPADSNVFALAWAMKKRGAKPHYSSKAPFKKKAESEEPVSNTVFEWKNDGSGDCMEVAARYVLENHAQNPNLILVHALVYGRGPIEGRRFTHAWVLDGNTVIDKSNGLNVRMDRTAYERMGGVNTDEEGAYMEYDHRSLVTNLKLSKHWGPWDLDPDLEEGIPTSVRQIGKLRKRLSADDLSLLDGAAATEAVRVEDSKLHEFAKVAKELGVPLTTELEQEDDGSWTIYLDSRVAAKIRAKLV